MSKGLKGIRVLCPVHKETVTPMTGMEDEEGHVPVLFSHTEEGVMLINFSYLTCPKGDLCCNDWVAEPIHYD